MSDCRLAVPFVPTGAFATSLWDAVTPIAVDKFRRDGSSHRPRTRVRLVHHGDAVRVRFDVDDRYVLARATAHQQRVCDDSCVEFFLRPRLTGGYFNLEINCGGRVSCSYIKDWRRRGNEFIHAMPLDEIDIELLRVDTSLPPRIWPERSAATPWWAEALLPIQVLEQYAGPIGTLSGQSMRANFFKCADRSSHPHWASWSPIGVALNFHDPGRFGTLKFL